MSSYHYVTKNLLQINLSFYLIKESDLLSCVWLFATSWTVAYQDPLSMGFSRQ